MLGVCSATFRGDGARWGSGSQAERLRDAEAMPHPRENGRLERGKDHSRTELSASGTPTDENQNPLRWGRSAKHSASRTSLRASKTSGLPLPLTREPPRRRRIGDTVTTERSISSTPHFDMSATLADFCLRPDETNFSSPALSPAKAYSRSKREAAPSKQRRAAPVYADVVDVLATDAAGRKYGRRRCDDGAM